MTRGRGETPSTPEPVFNYWDLRSSCGLPDTEEKKGVVILRGVRRA